MPIRKQDYPEDESGTMYVDADAEVTDVVPEPEGEWAVLIEETTGSGQGQRWSLNESKPIADRQRALTFAEELARQYKPQHPSREQGRRIYRTGEDVWTVVVDGAVSKFHFRISLARLESHD